MTLKHQADSYPSIATGPSLSHCSRSLHVVFGVCPTLLALFKAHQWLIEHVELATEAVSEVLYQLRRPSWGNILEIPWIPVAPVLTVAIFGA